MIAFFVLLAGTLPRAACQYVFAPENKEVALAGEIRMVHGYGPPGYGEDKKHDSRITYWVLRLPKAINVPCTPERPEWAKEDCRGTGQLRLFFPTLPTDMELESKAKKMQGREVLVTGILHRSDTVGEITPIYMNVIDVQPAEVSPKP